MTRGIGWPDPVLMRTRNAEKDYCLRRTCSRSLQSSCLQRGSVK